MLRPQDSATRERKNLNGLWQFTLDGWCRWKRQPSWTPTWQGGWVGGKSF